MSCQRLTGKVAVVTASTEGIGLAIAKRLAQEGAKVVISSRKQENVNAALEQLRREKLDVHGLVCHVGKAADRKKLVEETLKRYGGVDILVSNAGTNPTFGSALETSEEIWDKLFDTNLKSAYFLCQEFVPHIAQRGGGSIVFVSSIAAYTNNEALALYGVTKTALVALCKALTPQCATMKIRVNAIAPGVIKTRLSKMLWKNPEIARELESKVPMGRFADPDECAGAVAFLVSSDASYVTGETIVIAGGSPSRL